MAHYSQQQIQRILTEIDRIPVKYIVTAIRQGDIEFEQLSRNRAAADRIEEINEALRTTPDVEEQRAWNEIIASKEGRDEANTVRLLNEYVCRYYVLLPPGNHVEEARAEIQAISDAKALAEWNAIDRTDFDALARFLTINPYSSYAQQADTILWNMCQAYGISYIARYRDSVPKGMYQAQACAMVNAYAGWKEVSDFNGAPAFKLQIIKDYMTNNPMSPYYSEAQNLFVQTKADLFNHMRTKMDEYGQDEVLALLNQNIVNQQELINEGVATATSIGKLSNRLNPVNQTENADIESEPGVTDVFLFGIPSSGKTCVLTGLLNSNKWSLDHASESSAYIMYLITACRMGRVPSSTNSGFTTLIKASVIDSTRKTPITHTVNLVEMPGEDFLNKMVLNPDGKLDLDDMGIGASKLLSNTNPKAIFIVVDPCANGMLDVDVKLPDGSIMRQTIAQDLVLKRMISMLMKNTDIMKYVDTISFIMTKADTLGDRGERKGKAKEICLSNYSNSIDQLASFCKKYNINQNKNARYNGRPELYTFSLGNFYIGGVYDYDSTDSDELIRRIMNSTRGQKDEGIMDKIKKIFNS